MGHTEQLIVDFIHNNGQASIATIIENVSGLLFKPIPYISHNSNNQLATHFKTLITNRIHRLIHNNILFFHPTDLIVYLTEDRYPTLRRDYD